MAIRDASTPFGARLRGAFGQPATQAELFWWFLALFVPTVLLKNSALDQVYRDGFPRMLTHLIGQGWALPEQLLALPFFSKDVLDCAALVFVLFAVGHLGLRLPVWFLSSTSLLVCALIATGNILTIRQLGTFLTLDTVTLSIDWLRENPDIANEYLGVKQLLPVVPLAVLCALPIFGRRLAARGPYGARMARIGFSVLLIGLSLSAALYTLGRFLVFDGAPLPLRGYWSNTGASLVRTGRESVARLSVLPDSELENRYRKLAYPAADGPRPVENPLRSGLLSTPRHVIIVSLETAPRRYYPLVDNARLPNFERLGRRAFVSDRHYTNSPYTTFANYAMLSGTYPSRRRNMLGGVVFNSGIATVAREHGYRTTYVDSFLFDWSTGDRRRRMFQALGFSELVDNAAVLEGVRYGNLAFERKVRLEEISFDRAKAAVREASSDGTKAIVFIDTILGHYKWAAAAGQEELPAPEKLLGIAAAFDGLVGSLIDFFAAEGIEDEVLLLVTGDHGLRYREEFSSLGEETNDTDVAFNVPFLLYAPGLLDRQVRIESVTSHVDITPTLFELLGLPTESAFHHGSSILEPRLADRVTFLMSTGLSPVDCYHWRDLFFTANALTGEATLRPASLEVEPLPLQEAVADHPQIPASLSDPLGLIDSANRLFYLTDLSLLARDRSRREREPSGRE